MDCNVRGVAKSWTLLSDFPFQQVLLFTTDFFLLLIFFLTFWPPFSACGILVPLPGIEPSPLQQKLGVLTTGPSGKSL